MKTLRRPFWIFALPAALLLSSCEPVGPEVGSDDVFVLTAQFQVLERKLADNRMVVIGAVRNSGSAKFSPTWYVEAEFYRDGTLTYKLGGAQQAVTFSLEPGEETGFELRFSTSRVDVNQYPEFGIKNLRAVRPKN